MEQAAENTGERPVVWTVGHSNHSLETFLGLLEAHGIQILADVRSQPFSRFSPQFNADTLKAALTEKGIRYSFFGDTLGGRPRDEEYYDRDGHVRYDRVAESDFFHEGVTRLERGVSRGYRVALMCSEEDPTVCHRHLLVARVLSGQGYPIWNIRGDGTVADYSALQKEKDDATGQESLFAPDEIEEERPWRSLQSVLPGRARNAFSDD